jgi:diacylglycerol O-acyltransferase
VLAARTPTIHIDRHFRVTELPAEYRRPGGLERFACALDQEPLHRDRPLWEFVLITGLDGDRAAMVQRMDHTVTDGEGGLRMSMAFIDLERDAPDPPPVDRATGSSGGGLPLGNLLETIGHSTRKRWNWTVSGIGEVVDHVRHPTRLVRDRGRRDRHRRVAGPPGQKRRAAPQPAVDRPLDRTDRWPRPSSPFDRVIEASRSAGVTVNDLFSTAVVEAAVRLHVDAGHADRVSCCRTHQHA